MAAVLECLLMSRSHCCGNACQANLTKYSGATGKIQWQKALFGEGFINSSFSAPNSPADVLSVVASATAGLLWVTLVERQSGGEVPRLLLVESATGLVRKVVADCFPVITGTISTTVRQPRRSITPLSGGRCAVFAREVNSGSAYKVLIVSDAGTVSSSFTPTFSTPAAVSLQSLADGSIAVVESSAQRLYSEAGALLWSVSNTADLVECQHSDGNLLLIQQGAFVTTGAARTISGSSGASASSKSVTGGVQSGCLAGTGYALARATADQILLCDASLGTLVTITANVTSSVGATMAGNATRVVAACDRVRMYDLTGAQQWSELVPSNYFTSITLDAAGDVYVGSVRGNVRTEGTTINGF